jgi:hypothetical protein
MRRTREEIHQLVQHERKLKTRLQLATTRLAEAERERIWAIVAAHDAGFSIRNIAAATGLSRSRIHQLLQDHEARDIPTWLTHLRDRDIAAAVQPDTDQPAPDALIRGHIASEVEVLRWCIGSVAKFDFWAKSKNRVSGIQRLTDSQSLEKATLRQNPPRHTVVVTNSRDIRGSSLIASGGL